MEDQLGGLYERKCDKRMFERPLVLDGWDVIVFVPSNEEDMDRITCGNSLLALSEGMKGKTRTVESEEEYKGKQ